jgi:rare lipoprotein A (peptidoglycan hydrolase)
MNPDPLHHPEPVIRCRRCGDPIDRIGLCDDCTGRGAATWIVLEFLVVLASVLLVALVILVATPRSASVDSPRLALSGAPLDIPAGNQPVSGEARKSAVGWHRYSGQVPANGAPRIRGTATWYCNDGQRGTSSCTRGYGPEDMVAAIDTDLGFDKGDVVLVRSLAGDEQVTVTIVDVCGCPGSRLIDLTSGAFRRLAPLGIGVLPVTVELAGSERTLPPTDQEGAKP